MDNRKPSYELTREERLRDQLRHFPTMLQRWPGGTAKVVEFTTSHATLTLRIEHPQRDGNLQLCLMPPQYFHGPFLWGDYDIDISLNDDLVFVIRDSNADVEIVTEKVSIFENAKPHHRMVVAREN